MSVQGFYPHKPEDIAPGLALLERGSRTLDRQTMTRCHRLHAGKFDDGVYERESPDGEYREVEKHWYTVRADDWEDAIAPWEE